MEWVTRAHVGADQAACPWLIRRFIDPGATFRFVPEHEVMREAGRAGATPFGAEGARLGRSEGKSAFEGLIEAFELHGDPALVRFARIVHGADVAVDRYDCPEAMGLKAIAEGFALAPYDDDARVEHQLHVCDALYAFCQRRVLAHAHAA